MAEATHANETATETIMTRSNLPIFKPLHLLIQIYEKIKWLD